MPYIFIMHVCTWTCTHTCMQLNILILSISLFLSSLKSSTKSGSPCHCMAVLLTLSSPVRSQVFWHKEANSGLTVFSISIGFFSSWKDVTLCDAPVLHWALLSSKAFSHPLLFLSLHQIFLYSCPTKLQGFWKEETVIFLYF